MCLTQLQEAWWGWLVISHDRDCCKSVLLVFLQHRRDSADFYFSCRHSHEDFSVLTIVSEFSEKSSCNAKINVCLVDLISSEQSVALEELPNFSWLIFAED